MTILLNATEKAQRKKIRAASAKLAAPPVQLQHLLDFPLLSGISKKVIHELINVGEAQVIARDAMLWEPQNTLQGQQFFHFILSGQVGIGEYTEEAHKAIGKKVKSELFKKVGQTWMLLTSGDFWSDEFYQNSADLCMYSVTEVQTIQIPSLAMDKILVEHPVLKDRLEMHAAQQMERTRQMKQNEGREEIFDFYVKNGYSFSTRVKIRQLELCIDCDKCVIGCEERHGVTRLERFGPQIGLINFSVSCRQCYDPRCLIDCNFDAIARDPKSEEIRIDLSSCTGCSVCARNCPNDSIFIHPRPQNLSESMWTDLGNMVPKRVAVKCDRCTGYNDMACVAACPTGSMIDATPEMIFGVEGRRSTADYADTLPFEKGYGVQVTPRLLPKVLYTVSTLMILFFGFEWYFRRFKAKILFLPFFTDEVKQHRLGEGFSSGEGLGYWFGIIGAIFMLGTLLYVVRNRFEKKTQFMGSKYFWFSLHNALGVMGPAFVIYHANLHWSNWSSIGVFAAIIIVISGLMGQYLVNQLPGIEYENQRNQSDIDKSIDQLSEGWGQMTRTVNFQELMVQEQQRKKDMAAKQINPLRFLYYFLIDNIRQSIKLQYFRFVTLPKSSKTRLQKRQLYLLQRNRWKLEKRERFYQTAGHFLSKWKLFHIFFTIGLFLLMLIHVAWISAF